MDQPSHTPTAAPAAAPSERPGGPVATDTSPYLGFLDPAGALAVDLPCRACDYNLRGLQPAGRCPECGRSIDQSLTPDLLSFADPAWLATLGRGLRRLRAGCACLLAYPITATVLTSVGVLMPGSPTGTGASVALDVLLLGVALLLLLLMLLGPGLVARAAWLLTTPDTTPRLPPGPVDGRAHVASSQLVGAAALGTGLLTGLIGVPLPLILACAFGGLITLLLGIVALFSVLRELARRVPDEAAAAQATSVRGCTQVLVVVVSIMAVTTLRFAPPGDALVAVLSCGLVGLLVLLLLAAVILVLTLRLSHRLIRRVDEITALRQQGAPEGRS